MSAEEHPDETPPEPEKLPLDAWHRAQGARMVPFAGYHMPIQYTGPAGGIVAEHEWTRTSAGLFDVSHMGQLLLSGPDLDAAVEFARRSPRPQPSELTEHIFTSSQETSAQCA